MGLGWLSNDPLKRGIPQGLAGSAFTLLSWKAQTCNLSAPSCALAGLPKGAMFPDKIWFQYWHWATKEPHPQPCISLGFLPMNHIAGTSHIPITKIMSHIPITKK